MGPFCTCCSHVRSQHLLACAVCGHGWSQHLPLRPWSHDPVVRLVRFQPWQSAGCCISPGQHLLLRLSCLQCSRDHLPSTSSCRSHWALLHSYPAQVEDRQAPLGHHGHGQLHTCWACCHHSWMLHSAPLGCHLHWHCGWVHLPPGISAHDPHQGVSHQLFGIATRVSHTWLVLLWG